MREVAQEAIERARRGEGPTLIEAETYRFRGHSLADPDELRKKEEKAAYQVRSFGIQTSVSQTGRSHINLVLLALPHRGWSCKGAQQS